MGIPIFKPNLQNFGDQDGIDELAADIYEWLCMARMSAPCIEMNKEIDHFLSKYRVPGQEDHSLPTGRIYTISWNGMLAEKWVSDMSAIFISSSVPSWCSLTMSAINGESDCSAEETVLRLSGSNEYWSWYIK